MDINQFRKHLAKHKKHKKHLQEARTQDATSKEDARADREIAGYARATKKTIPALEAAFKDFIDEWERMVRVDGSARTQDIGVKDYPFKKEDVQDAETQFTRWLSKFSQDLDAFVKDLKGN